MRKKYKNNLIIFIAGIALVLISFFLDKKAFAFIDAIKNPAFDYFLGSVTHFGSIFTVLIVMTTLFMWGGRKREWIPVLWSSFLVSGALCVLLKFLTARARPFDAAVAGFFGILNYSFPSLHAAASFTAVEVLGREFPRFKWFWIIFAFIVAFSRIYLKVHYLSDVVFGALIGYSVGFVFVYLEENFEIFKKIGLKKWFISQKKR